MKKKPVFPYPDIEEEEYEDDPDNSKWDRDCPLIKIFQEKWNKWDDKINLETYLLSKCPLCRKFFKVNSAF